MKTRPARWLAALALMICLGTAHAAARLVFQTQSFQGPVHGGPGDLLMISGDALEATDRVVYQAVQSDNANGHPDEVPDRSTGLLGTAPIVQVGHLPQSVTIQLPEAVKPHVIYRLWVVNAAGQWSAPLLINDARPLWLTPSYAYATADVADLGRQVRVIGRNLEPTADQPVQIELQGPRTYTLACDPPTGRDQVLQPYLAQATLPAKMFPGKYSVRISVDGRQWIRLPGQQLEVRPDSAPGIQFNLSDTDFGGCRPDDGRDDSGCVQQAINAAQQAGGGTIVIPSGVWDVHQSFVLPRKVNLRGSTDRSSVILRHGTQTKDALATLMGNNSVSGLTFTEADRLNSVKDVRPAIQLGALDSGSDAAARAAVTDIIISGNRFHHVGRAIADSGRPIERLFVTHNEFGAWHGGLHLTGSGFNPGVRYGITDSVVRNNRFVPGSYIDISIRQGTIASEIGASLRVDFSANIADGTSTDALQDADDPRGWRAAFFWNLSGNQEYLLVARNQISCSGDKAGDGEAIAFDGSGDTFAFNGATAIESAGPDTVVVRAPLLGFQNNRAVDPASFYLGHWVQIAAGAGVGQARKIISYTTDTSGNVIFKVAPLWDVVPSGKGGRVIIGRKYWQVYTVGNDIDHRSPPCMKSNMTDRSGGGIVMWAPSADSVIAANHQLDANGITFQLQYSARAPSCPDCYNSSTAQSGLEIRGNRIEGEYDWSSDCSPSGITGSFAASSTPEFPPPPLGFGITIADNFIARADGFRGGAIDIASTWYRGPPPGTWPLVQGLMIYRNTIQDINGSPPRPNCHYDQRARIGIRLDGQENVVNTVLSDNKCERVAIPLKDAGRGTVRLCTADRSGSCECSSP